MQYDLWVYRENVGWWLEEEGFALAFAPTKIRKFMKEHKETHPVKLQFWSQEDQSIARQSGDHATAEAAMERIEPWSDIVEEKAK